RNRRQIEPDITRLTGATIAQFKLVITHRRFHRSEGLRIRDIVCMLIRPESPEIDQWPDSDIKRSDAALTDQLAQQQHLFQGLRKLNPLPCVSCVKQHEF